MRLSACFLACPKHCTWESSWFYWHYESGFMNVYAWFSAACYLTVCLSVYSKSIFVLWMPIIVPKEIVWLNSINVLKRVGRRNALANWTGLRLVLILIESYGSDNLFQRLICLDGELFSSTATKLKTNFIYKIFLMSWRLTFLSIEQDQGKDSL